MAVTSHVYNTASLIYYPVRDTHDMTEVIMTPLGTCHCLHILIVMSKWLQEWVDPDDKTFNFHLDQ